MHDRQHPDPWNIHDYNAINLKNCGLPEVPLVGIHGHLATKEALEPHRHRGVIEIHYIEKGDDDYWVAGKHYRLRNHDVVVSYPHEAHSTGFLGYGRQIYWIQVKIPKIVRSPLLCLDVEVTHQLSQALWGLPRSHFVGDPRFSQLIESIFLAERYDSSPVKNIVLANHVIRLLLLCVEWSNSPQPEMLDAGRYSEGIERVVRYIDDNYSHLPDTAEMADLCGLSISAFKAKFRKETGIPPKEFVLRGMVERAKRMLVTGNEPVTSIGLGLGFSSSQYFATVFKRFTGMSPLQYRNRIETINGKESSDHK